MNTVKCWPEPVVSVQSLADGGIKTVPSKYARAYAASASCSVNIPVVNLQHAFSCDTKLREKTSGLVSKACREIGFFQIVNHGVNPVLMKQNLDVWRNFFSQPLDVKQKYANNPATYEGYGSRLGVEKDALLDWSDYFYLHYLPRSLKDVNKWPTEPLCMRDVVSEYGEELAMLGQKLMKVLSSALGLKEDYIEEAFGGSTSMGACLRTNFYPKCPQPDLTLGLSPHCDPGGLTILLADVDVHGLQVLVGNQWAPVKPADAAFMVFIGDQIQILSNGIYKSAEHRVMVNTLNERISLAFFYNPNQNLIISPSTNLVSDDRPAMYSPMTFKEYRQFIRKNGIPMKQH